VNYRGEVPEELWLVLRTAWGRPISIQSDFARRYAVEVCLAASMGLVSTIKPNGSGYTTQWRLTSAGITALEHKEKLA